MTETQVVEANLNNPLHRAIELYIGGLHKAGIELDRKQLAALAIEREQLFTELVSKAKAALETQAAA